MRFFKEKMPEVFSSIFLVGVLMEIFNARDTQYKSAVRAVCTFESVKFKIVLPRSLGCSGARLVVTKEGETPVGYGMFWAGMHGEFHENWDLHFSATTPGLYFYHFELDTPWGPHRIQNGGRGLGTFSEGSDFVQVVYDSAFDTPDFIRGGVIYQIFPDRFFCSGKKKRGVDPTRVMRRWGEMPFWREEQMNGLWNNDYFGGDLKGIEQKLGYLKSLGVTCIYLNPIFEAHSNHRYDTADYLRIDPLLGDEADFKSLCKKAASLGIAVILDGVFSHTGCDSRYFNMYGHYDTIGAYNSKESPYYSWYKFRSYPDDYVSWWGIRLLPEVNEEEASYRDFICSQNGVVRKWLRLGASGWRLDVADELPDVFLDDLRAAVKAEKKDALIIGEVWENAALKSAYGARRRYLLGQQLDSVMNYPFANAVLRYVRGGSAEDFVDSVMDVIETYPPCVLNCLMNHIGTHDTPRAMTRLAGADMQGQGREAQYAHNTLSKAEYACGVQLLKLAALLQYTLPGVPSLYYGDETGMYGQGDPFNRACMNWDHPDETLLAWYRRLGEMRGGIAAFCDGGFVPVYAAGHVLAYMRTAKKSTVLVAVNAGEEPADVNVKNWNNAYALFGEPARQDVLHLPPYGCALLVK